MEQNKNLKGILLALIGAMLWGISGTCAQFLFQQRGITLEWLMSVRLISAGTLLCIISFFNQPHDMIAIWRHKKHRLSLLGFGIFGMLSVQYTYFATIKHSNAATATILQFSGPVFIAIYLALFKGKKFILREYFAIGLAVLGTFLLVTHGNFNSLNISLPALIFGILCAVSTAIYTLLPVKLLQNYGALPIISWGLLTGGIAMTIFQSPFAITGSWDLFTWGNTIFVVIFGTLIPFYLYLKAVELIGGQKASLLTSAEPLSAAFIAVVYLGITFDYMDWVGTLLIIATVIILSFGNKEQHV